MRIHFWGLFLALLFSSTVFAVKPSVVKKAEMLKPREYELLPVEAQKIYLIELRDVMVSLESLAGTTSLFSSIERKDDRTPAAAGSETGLTVIVGENVVPCVSSDKPCIFAGNMSCRKQGSCRIPSDSVCGDGVKCHELFGLTADGGRLCVTKAESKGYQNVSKVCSQKSRELKAEFMILSVERYEELERQAHNIWETNCWDKVKKMAQPQRDKAACEAVSIGMYRAKELAMDARKAAASGSGAKAEGSKEQSKQENNK